MQNPFKDELCGDAGSAWKLGTEAEFAAKYPSLAEQSDRAAFLEFGLKFLLYQPADKKAAQEKAATEAGRAVAIAQQLGLPDQVAEGSGTPPPVLPPPGMAWQDVPRIEGKKTLSRKPPPPPPPTHTHTHTPPHTHPPTHPEIERNKY